MLYSHINMLHHVYVYVVVNTLCAIKLLTDWLTVLRVLWFCTLLILLPDQTICVLSDTETQMASKVC